MHFASKTVAIEAAKLQVGMTQLIGQLRRNRLDDWVWTLSSNALTQFGSFWPSIGCFRTAFSFAIGEFSSAICRLVWGISEQLKRLVR